MKKAHSIPSNPWADRFLPIPSIDDIKQRAFLAAVPLPDCDKLPLAVAMQFLEISFDGLYVATEQACAIMKRLYEDAYAWSLTTYPSMQEYLEKCHSKNIDRMQTNSQIAYLTGLSGAGKSKLIEALGRILPGPVVIDLPPEVGTTISRALLQCSLNATSSKKQLLFDQIEMLSGIAIPKSNRIDALIKRMAKIAYQQGISRLVLDELQFLVNIEGSISKASQYLISMGNINIPVLFATNYDLLHKLIESPKQQETQRLLHTPYELYPESENSPDWLRIIQEMQKVAPEVFTFNSTEYAELLHRYTAGLVRLLRILLRIAFEIARVHKRTVDRQVLEAAYKSQGYEPHARDVRIIHEQSLLPVSECKRKDLISPLPPDSKRQEFLRVSIEKRLERASAAAVMSALTHSEKKIVEDHQENGRQFGEKQVIKIVKTRKNQWDDIYAQSCRSDSKF